MSTALVWFRRDLRVHDHPPLHEALRAFERVVPVFVLDERLLAASPSRARFLAESLHDLRSSLRERGGELVVLRGAPERELPELAARHGAAAAYFASDATPYAMARDRRVEAALRERGVEPRRTAGNFVADIGVPKPYVVFTPFHRAWSQLPRRPVYGAPHRVPAPPDLPPTEVPRPPGEVPDPLPGGETAGRRRMLAWDDTHYERDRGNLGRETSMLSPYLHFGCISARELEARSAPAYARQLAWRDFYAHVLLHNPGNARHAFRRELDDIEWEGSDEHFDAWKAGRTGFPVVDAGMRQLAATGYMHNRARLITASFLVKDLHIDWRRGEAHFMRYLLDGDAASNNGNWQWISSVGVDPAPLHRRLYNPTLQEQRHDPDGAYVRRWVGERVEPIVDHAVERRRTLAAYAAARRP